MYYHSTNVLITAAAKLYYTAAYTLYIYLTLPRSQNTLTDDVDAIWTITLTNILIY